MTNLERHEFWMRRALQAARLAAEAGEIPVGAVIVSENNELLAVSRNAKENFGKKSPTPLGHAELIAIHQAARQKSSWRLSDATLYVTLEPCIMCAGAILQARIPRIVYGTRDPKGGAVDSLFKVLNDDRLNHQCEVVTGVLESECSQILKDFFKKLRTEKRALKKKNSP